jgi:hypothetical protein
VQLVTRRLGLGTLQATAPRDNHSTTLMVGDEPSGQWMKNSVTDNPRFVAASMQTFLGWPDLLGAATMPRPPAAAHQRPVPLQQRLRRLPFDRRRRQDRPRPARRHRTPPAQLAREVHPGA